MFRKAGNFEVGSQTRTAVVIGAGQAWPEVPDLSHAGPCGPPDGWVVARSHCFFWESLLVWLAYPVPGLLKDTDEPNAASDGVQPCVATQVWGMGAPDTSQRDAENRL